jgi:hypothetical protein
MGNKYKLGDKVYRTEVICNKDKVFIEPVEFTVAAISNFLDAADRECVEYQLLGPSGWPYYSPEYTGFIPQHELEESYSATKEGALNRSTVLEDLEDKLEELQYYLKTEAPHLEIRAMIARIENSND